MKFYDTNKYEGTHTIEIAFQLDEYKGYVYYKMSGNCKGIDLLNVDADDVIERAEDDELVYKDMQLLTNDEAFSIELTDEKDNTCSFDDELIYLGQLIVGVRIVDFE